MLTVVRAGVESLQASTQRVRAEIVEPYKHIKTKSKQLASLHDTVEQMRESQKAASILLGLERWQRKLDCLKWEARAVHRNLLQKYRVYKEASGSTSWIG